VAKKGGSFWDNPFGGLFDFNRDGKEDFGEQWVAFQMFEEWTKDSKPKSSYADYSSPSRSIYNWRDHCEDGSEYGIDPDDYDAEDEYDEALKEAKYGWRDTCEDGLQYSVDPEDYETEAEYNEALETAKYAWRDTCEDGFELGVDPEDYETEEEYEEALDEARIAWRNDCQNGSDVDVYPEDYDTEEEYEEALAEARHLAELSEEEEFIEEENETSDDEEDATVPEEKDYPNRRSYQAALELATMESFPKIYTDDESRQRGKICELILTGPELPFKYLTYDSGFLIVQAAKEHFDLPCSFPDEDEAPKTWLEGLLGRVARRDTRLAIEVWAWCVKEFMPYLEYSPYESILHNDVLCNAAGYSKSFMSELIEYFESHCEFVTALIRDNPDVPCCADDLVSAALEKGNVQTAILLFESYLQNPRVTAADIESFVDACIETCMNWDELETMETFRAKLYPLLKNLGNNEVSALFAEWENQMREYIEDVERDCDKYQYTRRYAWRSNYRDNACSAVDVLDYETEAEYLSAVEEEKYAWRSWHQHESVRHNVPLDAFETEEEFVQEVNRVREREREERQRQIQEQRIQDQAAKDRRKKERVDPLAETDTTVYGFCSVIFPSSAQPYSYKTGAIDVQVGDQVIVPVGPDRMEVEATVVSVGKYMRVSAPYPVDKASTIIRKVSTNE